ncbi:MAG: NAD-binding protein, partial [Actinomycetota bacterium]
AGQSTWSSSPCRFYKCDAFEHPEETPPAILMDLMAKDLDLILELADEVGAPMEQAKQNRATVRAALAAGFSGHDLSAVAEFLRTRS